MAFFKKRKQEETKMTTLEEIRKAYEGLSDDDKKSFEKFLSDLAQESIAEQESDDGEIESQSAADDELAALGEKQAEDKNKTEETRKTDLEQQEQPDVEQDSTDGGSEDIKALREEIAKLAARLDLVERTPQKADDATALKLSAYEKLYN